MRNLRFRCTCLLLNLALLLGMAGVAAAEAPIRKIIRLSELNGLERSHEPVEVEIRLERPAAPVIDLAGWANSIVRVLDISREPAAVVPSQVHDIRLPAAPAQLLARLTFFADVPAQGESRYLLEIDPAAPTGAPPTGLAVSGEGVTRTIENEYFRIQTHDPSGQIDQIDLKFANHPSFRFMHGTLHWNPDFIVLNDQYPKGNYRWWYAHHFNQPDYEVEAGPVFFSIRRHQLIPGQDTVWMEVNYRFYAGLPWFLMESRMEAMKDTRTFAIRNNEFGFATEDFTHAAWRTESIGLVAGHRGELGSTPIFHDLRQGGHVLGSALPANLPWVTFCHAGNGYGYASLRLDWDNRNLLTGHPAPLYNSRTVLSEHDGGLYWFRSLVYAPRRVGGELTQEDLIRMIQPIPRGSSYYEKNACLFYEFEREAGFDPIDQLYLRLTQPLRVSLEEPESAPGN